MDISKQIFSSISLIGILPVIIAFLKLGIDALNHKPIEKVFLSPSRRLIIFFSQLIILSISTILITVTAYILRDELIDKEMIVGLAIVTITFVTVISTIIFSIVYLLSVKVKFSFKDDENQKWDFEKRISKNRILASRENNYFQHFDIDLIMNKEIKREMVKEFKLLGHDIIIKYYMILVLISLFLIVIGMGLIILSQEVFNLWRILVFLLGFSSYLYFICIKNNNNLIKQFQ